MKKIENYELAAKPERGRIKGTSYIPSYKDIYPYPTFPVHNEKFNKVIQYLEKVNKNLQVPNPSKKQIGLQDAINQQLNLSRLKILNDYALKEKTAGAGSDVLAAAGFRNWCGKGTPIYDNIKNDLDDPNKMFQIDRICRDHDINYLNAKTAEDLREADNIMMQEIKDKYILNLQNNFITGDYETDFSNWSASFKTISNYLMSLIETTYTGYVIKQTAQTAADVVSGGYKYIKTLLPQPELSDFAMPAGTFTGENAGALSRLARLQRTVKVRDIRVAQTRNLNTLLKGIKSNALNLGITFVATNIIKDRLFALGSLAMIALKQGIETITGYKFVDLTEHDVSDDDIKDIIRVFELLQNEYLMDSDLQPITVGDSWKAEQIEIPPVEVLRNDVQEVVEQNQQYNEVKTEIIQQEEKQLFPQEKLLSQTSMAKQPEEPEEPEELDDIQKMFALLKKMNIEQEAQQSRPSPPEEKKEAKKYDKLEYLKILSQMLDDLNEPIPEDEPIPEEPTPTPISSEESATATQAPEKQPVAEPVIKYKTEL